MELRAILRRLLLTLPLVVLVGACEVHQSNPTERQLQGNGGGFEGIQDEEQFNAMVAKVVASGQFASPAFACREVEGKLGVVIEQPSEENYVIRGFDFDDRAANPFTPVLEEPKVLRIQSRFDPEVVHFTSIENRKSREFTNQGLLLSIDLRAPGEFADTVEGVFSFNRGAGYSALRTPLNCRRLDLKEWDAFGFFIGGTSYFAQLRGGTARQLHASLMANPLSRKIKSHLGFDLSRLSTVRLGQLTCSERVHAFTTSSLAGERAPTCAFAYSKTGATPVGEAPSFAVQLAYLGGPMLEDAMKLNTGITEYKWGLQGHTHLMVDGDRLRVVIFGRDAQAINYEIMSNIPSVHDAALNLTVKRTDSIACIRRPTGDLVETICHVDFSSSGAVLVPATNHGEIFARYRAEVKANIRR